MNQETLKALEFDRLLSIISAHCRSEASKDETLQIRPLKDAASIKKRFGVIEDIRRLTHEGDPLKISSFGDIRGLLERLRPEDAVLEPPELGLFVPVFSVMAALRAQLDGRPELTALRGAAEGLGGFPELLLLIERSIGPEGEVLDTASSELYDIRLRRRGLETRIRKRLQEMLRDRAFAPFIQDEFITQRSGRWVLPVRMDSKNQIKGVVHDVSKSGETAFVEPLEIIGPANEHENLVADEKAEVIRILRAICRKLRASSDAVALEFSILVGLDVLSAVAAFSDRLSMNAPLVGGTGTISLSGARHPLLVLFSRREVVPIDVVLGGEDSVMVITGPNAGGKTIAIKTVGLLLLMALSGIPVPADSSSAFPVLNDVLVDIGDEQSIESNLSTFSAHVSNISRILEEARPSTLVLLDELGTGTNPAEGAALSCAVLHEFKEKGALAVATTHLVDIIAFVEKTGGMRNASMEFDPRTLTPLYRLKVGEPGESHALEIAERYGMPERILGFARKMLGSIGSELQGLIRELKEKRRGFEEKTREAEEHRRLAAEKEKLIGEKLSGMEEERREILRKAYQESRGIIDSARRKVGEILEGEKKARKALKALSVEHERVESKIAGLSAGESGFSVDSLKAGDFVFVRPFGQDAEVIEVDRKAGRARVLSGKISAEVPLSGLSAPRVAKKRPPEGVVAAEDKEDDAERSLNIIGLRVDEAISALEPFLNHASLGGAREVLIIHGIGAGILRRAVREHLEGHPLVEGFRAGGSDEGGAAVTVVTLK